MQREGLPVSGALVVDSLQRVAHRCRPPPHQAPAAGELNSARSARALVLFSISESTHYFLVLDARRLPGPASSFLFSQGPTVPGCCVLSLCSTCLVPLSLPCPPPRQVQTASVLSFHFTPPQPLFLLHINPTSSLSRRDGWIYDPSVMRTTSSLMAASGSEPRSLPVVLQVSDHLPRPCISSWAQ